MVDDDFLLPTPEGDHRGNRNERPLFRAVCDKKNHRTPLYEYTV